MMNDTIFMILFILVIAIALFIELLYITFQKPAEKNLNKYIRLFGIPYLLNTICLVMQLANIKNEYGWVILAYIFVLLVYTVVFLFISFINKTKILNWIYGTLYFIVLSIFLYGTFVSILQDKYHNDWDWELTCLSCMISYSVSCFIVYQLKKRDKEISLWSLTFNFLVLIYSFIAISSCPENIWYYLPFISILILIFMVYIKLKLKRKKRKKLQQAKENLSRFMPSNNVTKQD